ncbi:MAG: GDSL-type esterase/lipase family protein [Protaetiibacter sp.]
MAETFLPQMNGVVGSVLQMLAQLRAQGHETLVIAPRADTEPEADRLHDAELALLRSVALPGYPQVRLTTASRGRLEGILRAFGADVVHLASPFVLGWQALRAAERLGIPTVAVYQTDIPGYAAKYGLPATEPMLTRHLARIHHRATLTLAPSSASIAELQALGVDRVRLWARGVDGERFRPERRDPDIRAELAPRGETLIGYVGRLAPEKQVEDLRVLAGLPGTRLAIVGDGPSRAALERMLPDAVFLGFRSGTELASIVASFDLFVHPGEHETFCQTVQEALASGVPVVATGRGGPVDLVQSSRTGWLYPPGDLGTLRERVRDLAGDAAKRRAFAQAARASVAHRTWARLGEELDGHYRDAIAGRVTSGAADVSGFAAPARRIRPTRYVALGDSLTEGLCDSSRQVAGEYRGWADRLALLLAHAGGREPLLFANLAVRSRRIDEVLVEQLPHALALRPDLVSVLVGANDLVGIRARPERLAERLATGIAALRASGAEVLVVTPFAPARGYLRGLHARFGRFNSVLRRRCEELGAVLLDFAADPSCAEPRSWAEDRVHLSSHGHRVLSYRAAAALGVPDASELGALDLAMHLQHGAEDGWIPTARWLRAHVAPWALRRLRGRRAGDGRSAKHVALVPIVPGDGIRNTARG